MKRQSIIDSLRHAFRSIIRARQGRQAHASFLEIFLSVRISHCSNKPGVGEAGSALALSKNMGLMHLTTLVHHLSNMKMTHKT